MKIAVKVKPQVVYKLAAIRRDAEGNELSRRESAEIPNVFTDYGVEALYGNTVGDSITAIAAVVGTGSTTPDVSDTLLDAFLAGRYNAQTAAYSFVDLGSNLGYVQRTYNTVFPVGIATGNISEVGAAFRQGNPTITTPLCSRALVVDEVGNPTTFEVLPDEELQLTQFFRIHVNYADRVSVENVNGVDYTVTLRPQGLGSSTYWDWPGSLGATNNSCVYYGTSLTLAVPTGNGTPTPIGGGTINVASGAQIGVNAYVADSKQRSLYMRLPTGTARDVVGFDTQRCRQGSWQCSISPPLPKSALERFTGTIMYKINNTP